MSQLRVNYWELIKRTVAEWNRHKATQMAAALAYFTTFSIAPLVFLSISIAGLVFGEQTARDEIIRRAEELVGAAGASVVETVIRNVPQPSSLTTTLGLLALLVGATTVFGYFQDAMNIIWGVKPIRRRPESMDARLWMVIAFMRKRLISFVIMLSIGFLLLLSLLLSVLLTALGVILNSLVTDQLLPVAQLLMQVLTFVVTLGVITLLLAVIYKVLPDVRIAWRDVSLGAAITALLLTVGKSVIGLYLGQSGIASVFGAAGSVIVVLIWVYYSAQILFLGAAFTQVYARMYGSHSLNAPEDGSPHSPAGKASQPPADPEPPQKTPPA